MVQNENQIPSENPHSVVPPPQYPVEIFEKFIQVQAEEIEFKKQELVLRQQQEQNRFSYAKEALTAQKEDRHEERISNQKIVRYFFTTVIAIVLIIAVILGIAIFLNKREIAIKIIEYLIIFSAGGAGGYSVGRSRKIKSVASEEDSD